MVSFELPMDIEQIKEIIPHRFPFLLVDQVISFELNKSVKTIKNVSFNEPYFQGHFPQYPIMPGVLIIESMAQTAAILAKLSGYIEKNELFLFASITNTRFKKQVRPGDRLILEAIIINKKSTVGKFSLKAWVNEEIVAEAEITCVRKKIMN